MSYHRSPVSLVVANLYMEDFEIKVINTAKPLPRIWRRYVDDTYVVQKTSETGSWST